MNSVTIISALAALFTLAIAAPHAHGLTHHRLHARKVDFGLIADRSLLDGVCGGDSGFTCQTGYCCSQWGYCGTSEDYCGAGCNPSFGQCSAGSPAPVSATNSTSASGLTITVQSTISIAAVPSTTPASSISVLSFSTSTVISPSESSSVQSISVAEATKYHTQTWSAVATTTFATVTEAPSPPSSSSAIPTSSQAQPTTVSPSAAVPTHTESSSGANVYKLYVGDGTVTAGWPSQNAWVTFDSMWSANMKLISASCTEFGQANNSDEESNELKSAIQSIASSSGIDARFILAVVMQESKGCVRAPTTNYGVRNPGLMQDHNGSGTCNDASVSNPCPASEIQQMIKDGTTGTPAGDGLQQCMNEAAASDVSKYYRAARIYNSGSVTGNNLGLGVATHCYASDIANRLLGWVDAPTACSL